MVAIVRTLVSVSMAYYFAFLHTALLPPEWKAFASNYVVV